MRRFAVRYVLGVLVIFLLLPFEGVQRLVLEPLNELFAAVSGVLLRVLGEDIRTSGAVLSGRQLSLEIRHGCNGFETLALLLPAVVALPLPASARVRGLLLVIAFVFVLNLSRIVSLYYCGLYDLDLMRAMHLYVWPLIVILTGVALWLSWAGRELVST